MVKQSRHFFIPNIVKDFYEFEDMLFEIACMFGVFIESILLISEKEKISRMFIEGRSRVVDEEFLRVIREASNRNLDA